MSKSIWGVLLAGFVMAAVDVAQAQQPDVEVPRYTQSPVQFNLAPPGARSLAMGASFIGLADDATAAESNPAGLTILTRPEVSGHFRSSSFENEFPNTATSVGFGTFKDSVTSPSFFSFVYPFKSFALSAYYQRAADFKSSSQFQADFTQDFPEIGSLLIRDVDETATEFRADNVGLSVSVKLGPRVSVGASARQTRLTLDSLTRVAFTYPGFPGFSDTFELTADRTEHKTTFNLGALAHPSGRVSVGAVFKKGVQFRLPARSESRSVVPGDQPVVDQRPAITSAAIPDSFGAGAALRLTDRWTVLADVVRVSYSDLEPPGGRSRERQVGSIFDLAGEGGPEPLTDATEVHVGTEYAWRVGSGLVALRAGVYTDPDHDGLAGVDSDQLHATLGAGVVLTNRVQLDGAANIAKRVKEGLLSFVLRF
jgi:long-subunit fatty acid transport protein